MTLTYCSHASDSSSLAVVAAAAVDAVVVVVVVVDGVAVLKQQGKMRAKTAITILAMRVDSEAAGAATHTPFVLLSWDSATVL